jgi:N-methylhydantoinase B
MARAIPDKINAASSGQLAISYLGGVDPRNQKTYVTIPGMPTAGGMGARPTMDGIDVIDTDVTNLMSQPVEATESEFPLRILRCHLWQDSGGAGKQRGGLGYEFEVELLRGDGVLTHRRDRHNFAPWGLFGGHPAPPCQTFIKRLNGELEEIPSKKVVEIKQGERLIVFTTGGAGYGDPLLRDPEKVLEDVADGRVSRRAALENYGIVVRDDLSLDLDSTAKLREKMKQSRGDLNYIFDRGIEFAQQTGLPQRHS